MFDSLKSLLHRFLQPPPRPPVRLSLPWYARSVGADIERAVNSALDQQWAACHVDGLEKGFLLGLLVAVVLYLLFTRPQVRRVTDETTTV